MDGHFTRFSGVLTIDPKTPGVCRVDVTVDVASLDMANQAVRNDVLSPNLLDAVHFPTLAYSGSCGGDGIAGALTLHGTARPLRLMVSNAPPHYTAEAMLHRRDWGIKPTMARLTLARKIAAITLTLWKKGENFDIEKLKSQAA